MSDPVLIALIGMGGTVVGALGAILAARIQAVHKGTPPPPSEKPETLNVIGQSIDIRELRILRALFGETKGRLLEAYQDGYYGPSLQALVKRGLVKRIEKRLAKRIEIRYYMTLKGKDFCRAYLKELFETWQPDAQVLA
jgi:hypothetical protein